MNDTFYDIAFERSILSSVLFEPQTFKNIVSLKTTDFYLPGHANIFLAMCELSERDLPIDEEFLKKELIKNSVFDENVMLEIMSVNPIANIEPYVREVLDKSMHRKIFKLGIDMQKDSNLGVDEKMAVFIKEMENIKGERYSNSGINFIPLTEVQAVETQFALRDFLPLPIGTITLISASGGTGKSWTAVQMGMRYVLENENNRAALWLSEDVPGESKNRAEMINKSILKAEFDVFSRVALSDDLSMPPTLIQNRQFSHAEFAKMKEALKDYGLIILDPLIAFYGSDENDNSQARIFMQPFMNWAREEKKCIVFLHHSIKINHDNGASRTRGAGAFIDAARTVYEIDKIYNVNKSKGVKEMEAHLREFKLTKDNYNCIKILNSFTFKRQITPFSASAIPVVETTYMEIPEL